jgi:tetratricopeptide (TPR) repeat protein
MLENQESRNKNQDWRAKSKERRKVILSCILFLSIVIASGAKQSYAQNKKIDSLLIVLKTAKEDSNKVNTLNKLSEYTRRIGDYDSSFYYAGEAKLLAEKINYKKGLVDSYTNMGNNHQSQSNYSQALKNHFTAYEITKEIGYTRGIVDALGNIGLVYKSQGNYPAALKYYFDALKIAEQTSYKTGIAITYSNIGNIYFYQGNLDEALKSYLASLKMIGDKGDRRGIAAVHANIGSVYANQKNYSEALKSYMSSLKIAEEIGYKRGIGDSYFHIGLLYFQQKRYDKALENYFVSLKIQVGVNDKQAVAFTYCSIGQVYVFNGKIKEGNTWLEKSLTLSNEIGSKESAKMAYAALSHADSIIGNYKGALDNYKLYIALRDSLVNEDNTKKIVQQEMQYEFDKKETATKAEQEIKDAQAAANKKQQQIILFSVSGVLLLVVGFAFFVFRNLRVTQKQKLIIELQKQTVENQKDLVEEKQKEILDSIRYAKRIQTSLLPTDKYIERSLKKLSN